MVSGRARRWLGRALVVAVGAATLVAPPDVGATGSSAPVRYRVRSDAALRRLDVDVCFRGAPARVLIPGAAAAGAALVEARDDAGQRLPARDGRIELAGVAPGGCVHYRVDLDAALSSVRFSDRFGSDLLTSAGAWLWRPARLGAGGATLRFELPPGVAAATPWPRADGEHRLDRSAFQRASFTAFGRFRPHRFNRGGARVEVVRLGGDWQLDDPGTERFLSRVMDGVSSVRGRFPVDRVLIVLVPSPGVGMQFGMVRRGGGHSVAFVAGRDSTPDALEQSWVTWHELSHLQLPPLPQRDAWLYEGLATYYQEVLPARMGVKPAEQSWGALATGFERGAQGPPRDTLARASETMMQTGGFMRVYWSGTAFALEADVALRQQGSSLDRAITLASPAWRDNETVWSSERLGALWDRGATRPVLGPLGVRYAGQLAFPETRSLLERLGVARDGASVQLRAAELSAVREAIMRPVPP